MIEGEKTQFNGNLALLRVCTIIFMVNVLSYVISMFFAAGHGGVFASLWSALTTSSFEDYIGMIGMMIVSGVLFPVLLGILVIAFILGLGIYVLVKKNVTALKILAVLMGIWNLEWPVVINYLSGIPDFGNLAIGMILNANIVVIVAAFFVAPKQRMDENIVVREGFNLGLYRFCAVYFLVSGLSSSMHLFLGYPFLFPLVLFSFVGVLAGIFALVKKNADILTACALVMLAQVFWGMFVVLRMEGVSFFIVLRGVMHSILNAMTVVCIATFFIEPERTQFYLQRAKRVFLFWKK